MAFFPLQQNHLLDPISLPSSLNDIQFNRSNLYKPEISRIILIIIDALRLDFINEENVPFIVSSYRNKGCMFTVNVQSPTVTLPRIKALTTGAIPQFVDVIFNLASTEALKDSFLHKASEARKKIVFYGDDTWIKLYPNIFMRHEGVSSFYVNDYTEVDHNVTRNLIKELYNKDWDIMLLHYLGLDHIGHVYGPYSNLIQPKLKEMDGIIKKIFNSLNMQDDKTLIIITGDHGMKDSGGHGGSTFSETHVPLVSIGIPCISDAIAQTDVPSTLSSLLGIPHPADNIGRVISNMFIDFSYERLLYILRYNAMFLKTRLNECEDLFEKASVLHYRFLKTANESDAVAAKHLYENCSKQISDKLVHSSVEQDIYSLLIDKKKSMADNCLVTSEIHNDHNISCTSLRRRELFPSTNDDSDELGHISPLSDSTPPSSPVSSSFYKEEHKRTSFSKNTLADYIILENIRDAKKDLDKTEDSTLESQSPLNKSSSNASSLYLSPVQINSSSTVVSSPKKHKHNKMTDSDTPLRKVPDFAQETPQSIIHENSEIPKLVRKSPLSNSITECTNKRKNPFSESPLANKQLKLDHGSKVRTVLFPQLEMSVPTSSFYSKSNNTHLNGTSKNINMKIKRSKQKTSSLYLCARSRRFGQINAGVRHNIKKPKRKKISDAHILKAATNIIDNSDLNDYFDEIEKCKESQNNTDNQYSSCTTQETDKFKIVGNDTNQNNTQSRKRELSPSPDPNKKFFKFKRNHNATVTVDKHLKLKMDDGRLSLLTDKKSKKHKPAEVKLNLDLADLVALENEDLISSEKIDNILFSLDNDNEKENNVLFINPSNMECSEQLVLHAHNSVTMSENAIHLHVPPDNSNNKKNDTSSSAQLKDKNERIEEKSILLSPTSQMCNMTSVLALNSPKKAKQNINNILSDSLNFNEITSCTDMEQEKLFPIFYGTNRVVPSTHVKTSSKVVQSAKKFKPLPKNQLLLDAGQKRFGATQCPECKFVYHMGDPNDELIHLNYHNAGNILRFNGWKDERVVAQFPNNVRIIRIFSSDPKPWIKKVKDLLEVINRDLGYYEMQINLESSQIFLYIKNKTIAGCLVAEPKGVAYRMLNDNVGIDLCSEMSYPIKCGVSRIWVSQACRKEGIGTALLNCLRGNFMFGSILRKDDIAFSSPTDAGKAFAMKYFNTLNFLIYTS
ncbi:hypothetical protein ILUMI_22611 [Ignelater luminosus]|uniref:N-acetyltransferase domain-containing protein n=1 Tax=Ignelater luminosus TaxID=2038154 RepID=A0A8K0CE02_IGNLU|nr:hypothetical protein ILUMI_22611 [Ignelater luminosus]